jgi:hypothetical protein
MNNILLIGADKNNSTDGVIVAGIYHLLDKKVGAYKSDYIFLRDTKHMEDSEFNIDKKYDAVMVCGTPWLWDSFEKSQKYKNLLRCFELHKDTKKFFMGIGSCLINGQENSNVLERPSEVAGIKALFSNAEVYVRDKVAHDKLNRAGIKNTLTACPSFFCYGDDTERSFEDNVMIWYDPTIGISEVDWRNKDKLQKYYNLFLKFNNKYNPSIYCANKHEVKKALEIGLPEPKLIGGWENTLKIMKRANLVLSGRVHCSVPAFVKGKGLGLISVDTRSKVIEDFGGTIIKDVVDFNKLKIEERDFDKYLDDWKIEL